MSGKLVSVLAEKDGKYKRFELPVHYAPDMNELEGYVVSSFSKEDGDYCPPLSFLSNDVELPKITAFPKKLDELNAFLLKWTTLSEEEQKTTVALIEHDGGYWLEALESAESGEAFITDVVYYPYDEASSDKALGEYYFDRWHGDSDVAESKIGFGVVRNYVDYEKFGRDVRLNGCDGFWSDLYGRWTSRVN